ncbi:uncharacterized protein LOC120646162 isoform X2 [Panicum virgatum]|uniref:uncharacterized protein LOC120646162 isoform X2 n=1 Tax=Panicum virgatum TaxID=38727 RepID=UPI0019D53EBC|nr:uncharacterized protein LOC120646162 isoform X2 [Panicum virgatum]
MSRLGLIGWLDDLEDADEDVAEIPSLVILSEPDLFERGWGWQRLLPYKHGFIEWHEFKGYLQDYYRKNAEQVNALIMNLKPDCYEWSVPPNFNASHAAADLCFRREAKLQSLPRKLSRKDIKLSKAIQEHARLKLRSGDESFLAAHGFVEAELMCQLVQCKKFDPTNFISFSNQIRRSALNLMLHNVDKSTAIPAAAAMVGLAREAKFARYVLAREDSESYMDHDVCDMIREGTAAVLTMLEKEFARDTTASNVGVLLGAPTARKSEEPEARTVTKDEKLAGSSLQPSEPLK